MNLAKTGRLYAENECIDHPLGILCRCKEYKEIVDKFVIYATGARNPWTSDKIADVEEPISSADSYWDLQKTEANRNSTKPVLVYKNADENLERRVHISEVEKTWIPVNLNLVSGKQLRQNKSYLHRTAQNTQSADISVLTDMLPHRGRPIKRKDIDWDIGSHEIPIQMTDEPETNFRSFKGCFSKWAESYTAATGHSAY